MKHLYCNSRHCCVLLVFTVFLISAGCSRSSDELPAPVPDDGMVNVDWLLYEEQEQGTGQYPVRILVSRHYVRFDDNYDASDFLLLDRRSRTLFSVSHEEGSILVITSKPADTALPPDLVLTEERNEEEDAPRIAGELPVHVRFKANDVLCYEAVVIPGLLVGVAEALSEHAHLLGLRQLNNLDTVPETMQTPCFLSRHVYRPERHLMEGLPVREWDAVGYLRALVDYRENQKVSRSLFVLPDGYEQYQIN